MRESAQSAASDSGATSPRPFWLRGLDAAIFVTCALAVALLLEQFVDSRHVRLVFVAPVIASAARDGWLAAGLATLLSVLAIGYGVEDNAWPPVVDPTGAGPYALFVLIAACATFAITRRRQQPAPASASSSDTDTKDDSFRLALLSSLAHDFKAPLGAILGSISSLRHYGGLYDEDTRNEMLATAQNEVERLNRYIGNLLDITRLDTAALQKRMELIDIPDVVGAALKRAEPVARHHSVTTVVPPDLPMVPLDFMLAEQALYNLIENAASHAPAQTEILITVEQGAGTVKIAVEDQGPGIKPESLQQIFAPFYRIPCETSRAGIGLGLPVARGFIEAMGGTLTADNRPAGGARFLIQLPLQQSAKT